MKLLSRLSQLDILSGILSLIFFSAIPAKFLADPQSVYIFQILKAEPHGRWLAAGIELLIIVLFIQQKTRVSAAYLAALVSMGAILSHLTTLGIVIHNDHGFLFIKAVICLILSTQIILLCRKQMR